MEADWPGPDSESDEHEHERETAYELLQRGQALMRGRHHAQASIVLARAAHLEPRKGSILEALGRAYYNSGQHDRARETFEELLEVDPSAHYAHYALGQSLKLLGRRREAGTHLRIAVALYPGNKLYQSALERLGPPDSKPKSSRRPASTLDEPRGEPPDEPRGEPPD
jgi:tetratricopeptide (TPR) repeat protein